MHAQPVKSANQPLNRIENRLNVTSARRNSAFLRLKEQVQERVTRRFCAESAVALLKRRWTDHWGQMDVTTPHYVR